MSEVKNVGAPSQYAALFEPDRDRLVKELSELATFDHLFVGEGRLQLTVPFGLALAHVDPHALLAATVAIKGYAALVVRAVATLDGGTFRAWAESQHSAYVPGQIIELGPNWSILCDALAPFGDDVADDLAADEAAPSGVAGGKSRRQDHDDSAHAVEQRRLLPREPDSLDHPEPLVPRRSTPPP